MLPKVFLSYGCWCALHPWEVIFSTIACAVSLSSLADVNAESTWTNFCHERQASHMTHLVVLSITRCLAIGHVYIQFKELRSCRSYVIIGLVAVYSLFSASLYIAALSLGLRLDSSCLLEGLPLFILLMDVNIPASFATYSLFQGDKKSGISHGLSLIAPSITRDSIVKVLVIAIGTMSGMRYIELACSLMCLAIITNYISFITILPACLSIFHDVSNPRTSFNHNPEQSNTIQALGSEKHNEITERFKSIMSVGLVLLDIHHYFTQTTPSTTHQPPSSSHHQFVLDYADHILAIILSLYYLTKHLLHNYIHADTVQDNMDVTDHSLPNSLCDTSTRYEDKQSWHNKKRSSYNLSSLGNIDNIEEDFPRNTSCNSCLYSKSTSSSDTSLDQTTDDSTQSQTLADSESHRRPRRATFSLGDDDFETLFGRDKQTQTDDIDKENMDDERIIGERSRKIDVEKVDVSPRLCRSIKECVEIMTSDIGPESLSDQEIMSLVKAKYIPAYKLESILSNHSRGVSIRRQIITESLLHKDALSNVPYTSYDYKYVTGACCENVVGYIPVPVGIAGPLRLNNNLYHVPMATTEGTLVASTNRGCRAIQLSGGVQSVVVGDGMSRGPVVKFATAIRASQAKKWMEQSHNFSLIKSSFEGTSRFAQLTSIHIAQASRHLYIRFVSTTGDAMGMNMVCKGSERALHTITEYFPDMNIMSLSGNYCTDKKSSAVNWIQGRGKTVVSEAIIPHDVVTNVLKTTVPALLELNVSKNLIGSAMAGSIGGFNAHAANIVTAVFIATGQDPAQNVTSSNCITLMEATGPTLSDLYISCTMPSLEVGTVGGGTILPPQAACLQMLGVKGPNMKEPGYNARVLAQIVCGTVLAGELSLMSALAAGHLVRSHMQHNRSSLNIAASCIDESKSFERHTTVAATRLSEYQHSLSRQSTSFVSSRAVTSIRQTETETYTSISAKENRAKSAFSDETANIRSGGSNDNIEYIDNSERASSHEVRKNLRKKSDCYQVQSQKDVSKFTSAQLEIELTDNERNFDVSLRSFCTEQLVEKCESKIDKETEKQTNFGGKNASAKTLADECIFGDIPRSRRKTLPTDYTCIPL